MGLRFKERINKELEGFFQDKLEEAKFSKYSKELIEKIKEYTLRGGKRIRPSLIIFSYLCFKELDEEIIKISICIELMQTYLLIHDDIMDRDNLRRGGLTIHETYKRKYNDEHMGISLGILAGDLAASFLYEPIDKSKIRDGTKIKVYSILNSILNREADGQMLDMVLDFKTAKEDILSIYKLKTVPYTTEGPVEIGCVLAGADKKRLKLLKKYAINIGIAFQIIDDILGIFGDKEKTGKPNDSDIKEGKKTLLIIKALEKTKDKEKVLKLYGKKDISDGEIGEVKGIIKESGALEECKEYVKKIVSEAINILENTDLKEEGKKNLISLAEFIMKREK